jgi:hypothetical protein
MEMRFDIKYRVYHKFTFQYLCGSRLYPCCQTKASKWMCGRARTVNSTYSTVVMARLHTHVTLATPTLVVQYDYVLGVRTRPLPLRAYGTGQRQAQTVRTKTTRAKASWRLLCCASIQATYVAMHTVVTTVEPPESRSSYWWWWWDVFVDSRFRLCRLVLVLLFGVKNQS